MRKVRVPKGPKQLIDKVRDIDKAFADSVYALSDDNAREKMITFSKHIAEIEKAKKDDQDLKSAKESLKVKNETYTGPLKAARMKIALLVQILMERGKL